MRRAARTDGNHTDMVNAFKSRGVSVQSLAAMGKGVPDLLVSFQGFTQLVEVKMPKGKLTGDQEAFKADWQGPIAIVRDEAGVETVCGFMRTMANRLKHD